jgi:uncharacterized flavoprotein (TIGR03862 family)
VAIAKVAETGAFGQTGTMTGLTSEQTDIAVIGGGPAGLMAAEVAARGGLAVTVYERMPTVGRKLLIAGRGGLNLTHSEPFDRFVERYGAAAGWLRPILQAFTPADLVAWADGLGEPTFVGSSGRVFPTALKASPLLRAWLARLAGLGVRIATRHLWQGWDEAGGLRFAGPDGPVAVTPGATVLALGGASWARLGSDGAWAGALAAAGVPLAPFRPANCGVRVAWSAPFRERFAGTPLKNVALDLDGRRARGDAVIAAYGLEGGAVYALSSALRDRVAAAGQARLRIDLRPDMSEAELRRRLGQPRGGQSLSNHLRRALALAPVAVNLLREAGPLPADAAGLAALIKAVPLDLVGTAPLDRAISSAGGVERGGLDGDLMLAARPGVYVAGEMLDWEAPTGGYLLQASFATGAWVGRALLRRFGRPAQERGTER